MSIWTQLQQLIRRFFPNRVAQFCLYLALAVMLLASPTRQRLVYFGVETLPGWYYYAAGGVLLLLAVVLARVLPRRQFASVAAALRYWVDRPGGLDYAAYFNDLAGLARPDGSPAPAAERLHADQLKVRSDRLALKMADEEAMAGEWRRVVGVIHRAVQGLDAAGFAGPLLGKNEKITFDTVMGAVYYWRLSDREVLVGVTTDQASVDNRKADDEFTALGESIQELTVRRRGG